MERIVSEVKIDMSLLKETCNICLDDNISPHEMFSVDFCRHRFCSECMKQYIEARLLEGRWMICPYDGCDRELRFSSCVNLLTPKLKEIWVQRSKEDLIPVTERVYCPNPRCSALMSVKSTEESTVESGVKRLCVRCGENFCINCKVPWHNNLSCDNYNTENPKPKENDRKLKSLANKNMWRQCPKCQNMIGLSEGCASVECRCGHVFCYRCGADDGRCPHGHNFYDLKTGRLLFRTWCLALWCCILLFVIAAGIVGFVIFMIKHFAKK